MAYEAAQFRIIPDPKNPKKFAFMLADGYRDGEIFGGFPTAKAAKQAFDRYKKEHKK